MSLHLKSNSLKNKRYFPNFFQKRWAHHLRLSSIVMNNPEIASKVFYRCCDAGPAWSSQFLFHKHHLVSSSFEWRWVYHFLESNLPKDQVPVNRNKTISEPRSYQYLRKLAFHFVSICQKGYYERENQLRRFWRIWKQSVFRFPWRIHKYTTNIVIHRSYNMQISIIIYNIS